MERLCEHLGLRDRQESLIDQLCSTVESTGNRARMAEVLVRQGDLYTLLRRYEDAESALQKSLAGA